MHEIKDITIIGGGPTGLFASFYAGMRGATAQIVDTLPQLGGQLTALYPEKYIFDVAGFAKILAKDLVRDLTEQAAQFNFPSYLGQHVQALEEEDGHFVIVTDTDRFPTRSVLIAAGIGAFSPDATCSSSSVLSRGALYGALRIREPPSPRRQRGGQRLITVNR